MRYLLIGILFFQIACSSSAQQLTAEARQTKAERKPFQKSSVVIKSPKEYSHRETKNGSKYDPRPRVVAIDEKAGRYELRWIGYDGKAGARLGRETRPCFFIRRDCPDSRFA